MLKITRVHTPGPWKHVKAERLSHDAPEAGPNVSEGGILGGTPDDPRWVIEGEIDFEPDAWLIEVGPDLLAALEMALPFLDNEESPGGCDGRYHETCKHCAAIHSARAAIAKARGQVPDAFS